MRVTRVILAFVFTSAAWSQGVTSVMSGVITPAKAANGASITIINADTGVTAWSGKTNASGIYRAPDLPAGRYDIAVSAAGFRRQQVSGIELSVEQQADIVITMQAGEVVDTVTVEGRAEGLLSSDSSSLSTTITPSQLQDLPLPSRYTLNLLALTPGVSSGGDITSQSGLNSSQLVINGSRTLNNEFLLDGVSVVSGSTGAPQTLPPADSIREFNVLAASYSAEYGRTSGATVTLITNSGTNLLHGAAYGYFRNEDLDANNYFNNLLGKARSEDRYNLFGAKLGGPLSIPKVYDGHNKSFFFLNYEGLIQASPYSLTSTVPSGAYETGNFSASPTKIYNPATKAPFSGNIIPANLIDPAALKILALAPGSNSPGTINKTDNVLTNNFVSIGSSHPIMNTGVARLDDSITNSVRLFGTFVHYNNYSPIQPVYPGSPLENAVGSSETTGYEATAGLTKTWSPTFITEVRFAFFRNSAEIAPPSSGINVPSTLGIMTSYGDAAPEINISGFSQLGTNSNTKRSQIDNNYQTHVGSSKALGNHLIQFGLQFRKNQFDDLNPTGDVNGSFTFDGSITNGRNSSGDPVNALADFLLGDIKTASYSLAQPLIGRRNYNIGLYIQDDWKVTPRLTLNLGLRWEYESPLSTANNEYSRVDPASGEVLFEGKNASDTLNLRASKLNFAPRAGFAYSLTPKTVIRSAFGIFYAGIFSDLGGQVLFPGYTVEQAFNNLGTGIAQPFGLSQGLPAVATNNVQNPQANIAQFGSPANPLTLTDYNGFTQASPHPYVQQWNFGIQHEVAKGTIVEVNYVGTHGVHLPVEVPTNTVPFNSAIDAAVALANSTLAAQEARPYPGIGSFNSINLEGTSTYQAFQASVRRQYGSNLTFVANYTRSKSLDDASGIYNFSQPSGLNIGQFPQQLLGLNKGLSEFDRPNDFTTAILYRTGGNHWLRNFEISPILTVHDGLPLYIGQSNENPAQTGTNQQRPYDLNPSVSLYTAEVPNGTGVQYLLPTSAANFPLAPSGPLFIGSGASRTQVLPVGVGSLGRDVVRAPGQLDLDVSIGRSFDLRERLRLTFRMEAYNALNHTNFQAPASGLTLTTNSAGQPIWNSPNYGLITAANQSRFLQLVGRFDF
jgi:Carboxypeptidase regulatory-like domain/TonB-dependent Receptor Plug Domain/TonB dependent receptor